MTDIDPRDLPILAELEEQFRRMVADELASPPRPVGVDGARRGRAAVLSTGRRILGRAALAGALAGVVGATALATKSVVRGGHATPGPVVLERAHGHELVLRHYQGRLCVDVSYANGVASRCTATPPAGGLRPLSALTAAGRIVTGITGADVAAVRVQSAGRGAVATTRAIGGTGNKGLRWFAVVLPSVSRDRAHAAVVTPRGGRAVVDCTLGSVASCRAARQRAP